LPPPPLLSPETVARLPAPYAGKLDGLVRHLRTTDLRALQEEYVDTFDHTRRRALHLTYFAYGDTRRRGVALVQFKQAYRKAGLEFDAEELPDHLCAVLRFGATPAPTSPGSRPTGAATTDGAWRLLLDHRAGIEVLRLALRDQGSPWLAGVEAVCDTLPALRGEDVDAVRRLVAEGPPGEEVGVESPMTKPYLIDPQIPVGVPR
jgi:nitrate reductase molybdenum cofactor assembly chaperone NarJ/NarW